VSGYWEHFSQDAGVGIRGYGATREEAVEQAAMAMTAMITDLAIVEPREVVEILCRAPDDDRLFAEWLNNLIYEMAVRDMLFSRFSARLDGGRLDGHAWGERVDASRHHSVAEVKGVTQARLRVGKNHGGWLAQTGLDV
jgi:tRNA nucleotidyltransferase (CCA-adding enzyme)